MTVATHTTALTTATVRRPASTVRDYILVTTIPAGLTDGESLAIDAAWEAAANGPNDALDAFLASLSPPRNNAPLTLDELKD